MVGRHGGWGVALNTDDEIAGAVEGDPARQAIASLRGYAYQLYVSVLAWIGLSDGEVIHLEVAEDYAVATRNALEAAGLPALPRLGHVGPRLLGGVQRFFYS